MKKLRLEIDELKVESFDVREEASAARGTVHGRDSSSSEPCDCGEPCNWGVPSYEVQCWWTGDPVQDCYPASELNPCTDYQC